MIRRHRILCAYAALRAAQAAYDAACRRGDTRAMSAALTTLQRARHVALGLEVGV